MKSSGIGMEDVEMLVLLLDGGVVNVSGVLVEEFECVVMVELGWGV
jgi:hypothetical protein